jgi:hypothetical protein
MPADDFFVFFVNFILRNVKCAVLAPQISKKRIKIFAEKAEMC